MSLANLIVVVVLMGGILWGLKVGFYESAIRALAVVGASLITMATFAFVGRLLQGTVLAGKWGTAYGAAWTVVFVLSLAVFWVGGNFFLKRGRVAFYDPLERVLGVLLSVYSSSLGLSAAFIALFLSPLGPSFMTKTMSADGSVLLKADRRIPQLYNRFMNSAGALDLEGFMKQITAERNNEAWLSIETGLSEDLNDEEEP